MSSMESRVIQLESFPTWKSPRVGFLLRFSVNQPDLADLGAGYQELAVPRAEALVKVHLFEVNPARNAIQTSARNRYTQSLALPFT